MSRSLRLRLPATSANLGPGFDAVGLAMGFYLHVEAQEATEFKLSAAGRDAAACGRVERNLLIETYRDVLGGRAPALEIVLNNEIPLGMGCGSSAAALLAGVALADHFGGLGLGDKGIIAEASRREGHPDNVAACWLGGFTVSAQSGNEVLTATFAGDPRWRLMLVVPGASLSTSKARGMLPEGYSRADAVFNVQRSSLLVAAFAERRLDLLRVAMEDRIHQPYREAACPLLGRLRPLAGSNGIAGVALSGAGPSVLLVLEGEGVIAEAERRVRASAGEVEILTVGIAGGVERGEP